MPNYTEDDHIEASVYPEGKKTIKKCEMCDV